MTTKRIEWDMPRPALRMRLLVEKEPLEDTTQYGNDVRLATIDDLKQAGSAVGLSWVDRSVFDAIVAKGEANRVEADSLRASVEMQMRNLNVIRMALDPLCHANQTGIVDLARDVRKALDVECTRRVAAEAEVEALRAQLAAATAAAKTERANAMGAEEQRDEARARCREAAQVGIACLGSVGPEDVGEVVERLVARLAAADEALVQAGWAARATSPEGRATDEELRSIYAKAETAAEGVAAVAARVRRERPSCLVERLVARGVAFNVWNKVGNKVGTWVVHVLAPSNGGHYTTTATDVPAADVPATLARLAGLREK